MKHRDLNAPPSQTMAEIVRGLKRQAESSKTGAHGVKHMGANGDSVWTRPDGSAHSVREIDADLDAAQGRIDDAEAAAADAVQRVDAAEQDVADARDDLTELEDVTLPNAVSDLEAADQVVRDSLNTLDGKLYGTDGDIDRLTTEARDAWNEAVSAGEAAGDAWDEAVSKLDQSEVETIVTESANGKNSITRSPVEPNVDGAVTGDSWMQVDYQGNAIAEWFWSEGEQTWWPTIIKNELLESLDVHKLKATGSIQTPEAVIEKLWVDGLVGKTAAFNSLTVAPENMVPDPGFSDPDMNARRVAAGNGYGGATFSIDGGILTITSDGTAAGNPNISLSGNDDLYAWSAYPAMRIVATTQARVTSGVGRATMTLRYRLRDGTAGSSFLAGGYADVTSEWEQYSWSYEFPQDIQSFTLTLQTNNADTGTVEFRSPFVAASVGSVLIEDGAITTPKLTVTEEMSANIVDAMSVTAKELVVTEQAILNHATLIGDTVVDDINVTGKLIGEDGVFTGTVDFANINVTGDAIVDTLAGKTISGASITTPYTNGTRALLSNTARDGWPALAFETSDGHLKPAALAAYDGVASDEGVWPSGTLVMQSAKASTSSGEASSVAASPDYARMISRNAEGQQSAVVNAGQGTAEIGVNPTPGSADSFRFVASTERASLVSPSHVREIGVTDTSCQWWGGLVGDDLRVNNDLTVNGELHAQGIDANFDGRVTVNDRAYFHGDRVRMSNIPTTDGQSAVHIDTSYGNLYRVTSSLRYKRDVEDWTPAPEDVLALRPVQYTHDDPNNAPEMNGGRSVGFIAEEVHDLGLTRLVHYADDEDGNSRPESLNYDRFAAAHQVVLKDHEARIAELESENADLRGKLDDLSARLDAAGI